MDQWGTIPGLGYVVNSHGDHFRPLTGDMGPLPNGRNPWLINGGDPNYLLSGGPILQVVHNLLAFGALRGYY